MYVVVIDHSRGQYIDPTPEGEEWSYVETY
jgi:hypothetical protein